MNNHSWEEFIDADLSQNAKYYINPLGMIAQKKKNTDSIINLNGSLNNGYKVIWVKLKSGKRTARYIHIMVAKTFIKNPNNKEYVIHRDHNKQNNHVDNLIWAGFDEWKSHNSERFRQMKNKSRLERNPWSKLTETQVIRLKKKLFDPNRKTRISILAKQFNVSEGQLYRIKRGENWGHIPNPYANNQNKESL